MQKTKPRMNVRGMVTLAMLATMAYAVMFISKSFPIPMLSFGPLTLTYDPKDIIIAIGGFIYGPLSALAISAVVSLLEMITISATGPIGCAMNILSTCALVCPAAFIYKRRQTLRAAVLGLACGVLAATAVMLLWNYFLTPLYTGLPRESVAAMLLPLFLPYNLIKGGINAAVTMLAYKPLVLALRRGRMIPPARADAAAHKTSGKAQLGVVLVSLLVLASCILLVLIFRGII